MSRVCWVIYELLAAGYYIHPQQRQRSNAGSLLGQRRRRRTDIDPALGQCVVFVTYALFYFPCTHLSSAEWFA